MTVPNILNDRDDEIEDLSEWEWSSVWAFKSLLKNFYRQNTERVSQNSKVVAYIFYIVIVSWIWSLRNDIL